MTMPLDRTAVGAESETFRHTYGWKDLALYALGVGATMPEDVDLLYERRGPDVLPTYAAVAAFAAVRALQRRVGGSQEGLVHLGQRIVLHRRLATEGTLRTRARLEGIYDMRRVAQSILHARTESDAGEPVADTEWVVLHTRDVAPGGEAPPRRAGARPPARPPDVHATHAIPSHLAALYRLNGDDNPLHIDTAAAAEAGYREPLLHGLCSLGIACLTMRRAGVPLERVRVVECQFRAPAFAGDTLAVDLWREPSRLFLRAYAEARPTESVLAFGHVELT
jgi:acyl dehydratase